MIAIIKFGLTVLILFEFLYSNQVTCINLIFTFVKIEQINWNNWNFLLGKLTCPVGYVGDNCEIGIIYFYLNYYSSFEYFPITVYTLYRMWIEVFNTKCENSWRNRSCREQLAINCFY